MTTEVSTTCAMSPVCKNAHKHPSSTVGKVRFLLRNRFYSTGLAAYDPGEVILGVVTVLLMTFEVAQYDNGINFVTIITAYRSYDNPVEKK